jgi:error-prone DNA polymerase
MYLHLTSHTAFSLQEGLGLPADLAQAAAAAGMSLPCLTDDRPLSGAVEFEQACQEWGVQPMLSLALQAGRSTDRDLP